MDPKTSRGFLNANPGNLDRGEPPWNGEIRDINQCVNDVQRMELTHGRFCVFTDAPHGIRAIARNLAAYRSQLGCKTIRDFINRWAPPNENNTAGYIQRVASQAGLSPDEEADITQRPIIKAIIEGIISVECAGNPYDGDEVDQGLTLAGVSNG